MFALALSSGSCVTDRGTRRKRGEEKIRFSVAKRGEEEMTMKCAVGALGCGRCHFQHPSKPSRERGDAKFHVIIKAGHRCAPRHEDRDEGPEHHVTELNKEGTQCPSTELWRTKAMILPAEHSFQHKVARMEHRRRAEGAEFRNQNEETRNANASVATRHCLSTSSRSATIHQILDDEKSKDEVARTLQCSLMNQIQDTKRSMNTGNQELAQ